MPVAQKIHTPAHPGAGSRAVIEEVAKRTGQIIEPASEEIAELKIAHEVFGRPTFAAPRMTGGIVLATFRLV